MAFEGRKTPSQEMLFKEWQAGNAGALERLFIIEKPLLYDFLLRMTGQVDRAWDTIDEVEQVVGASNDEAPTLEDLRISIYRTARNFCADVWNADTARMMNESLDPKSTEAKIAVDEYQRIEPKLLAEFQHLDQVVRTLPGEDREVILLKIRGDFSDDATGDIMGLDATSVRSRFGRGLDLIRSRCDGKVSRFEFRLVELPLHPTPTETMQGSTNLSVLIQDLKESRKPRTGLLGSLVGTLLVLGLVGALIVSAFMYYFNPEFRALIRSKLF